MSQRRSNTQQRDSTVRTATVVERASCQGDNNSTVGSSLREALAESSEVTRGTAFLAQQQGETVTSTFHVQHARCLFALKQNL